MLYIDGIKRVIQTKKEAEVFAGKKRGVRREGSKTGVRLDLKDRCQA